MGILKFNKSSQLHFLITDCNTMYTDSTKRFNGRSCPSATASIRSSPRSSTDVKCITVRGMILNEERNLLFTARFTDRSLAENLTALLESKPQLALQVISKSNDLKCVVLPGLNLGPIPEGRAL